MKKNIVKILILLLLLALPATSAFAFVTDAVSTITVATDSAIDITNTTATLRGHGEDTNATSISPATAYFRYSTFPVTPIFCNDIYGANMISTKDLKIDSAGVKYFSSEKITGLTPDTTYYYCAIISNKANIEYGGTSIVKEFHTNCDYQTTVNTGVSTTVNTIDATNIQQTSAFLSGSYCSVANTVKTSFAYREMITTQTIPAWKTVGEVSHAKGNNSNIYGKFNFLLSGLKVNTTYQFKAVATSGTGSTAETFEGSTLKFLTFPASSSGGGSNNSSVNNNGGTVTSRGGTITTGGSSAGSTNSGNGTGNSGTGNGASGGNNAGSSGTSGTGSNPNNTGSVPVANLKIGIIATPPGDAVVHYHEGIETVLTRQIMANTDLARAYGYIEGTDLQGFAWYLSDQFARAFGYVSSNGTEIRVLPPDVAAYQLVSSGNNLTIYEYYNGVVVNIRTSTETLKNAAGYEYYFKKR